MLKLQIIGNLAADAKEHDGKDGKPNFITFTVLSNDKFGETEFTTSVEVSAASSGVLEYLKKGKKVYVEGWPSSRGYMTKDNQPASQMRISRDVKIELL